ncbi:LOW QUALITY PROTEIN: hypothetical protein M8C21_006061, partial [Ambrosia artemisiifolia]
TSLSHTTTFFSLTTRGPNIPTVTTTTTTCGFSYFKPTKTIHSKSFSMITCSLNKTYIPHHIQDPNRIRIFDTTLRDGEQAPGAAMTPKQKLAIAHQLTRLGVDIIEAGFPASNKADLETVKLIAQEVGNSMTNDGGPIPVISALARCNKNDIDKAWQAVRYAKYPRIHIFIATSEIHMKHKLKMSKEQVVEKARTMVAYARSLGCNDVQFSPEDAGRSEREFLYEVLGEAIKAGATTLCIPDTVGYNWPREFGQLIADIKANTPGVKNVVISTHCHNDLGLATANTLEGAYSGARQLEVTINGIGERAGNASLEEVVMAIKSKGELLGGLYTCVDTRHISMTSKMVEDYSGMRVQQHKPIVGANAFSHESGIHQDGMLKNKNTYEIMSPEDIGIHRSNEAGVTLGKLRYDGMLKNKNTYEIMSPEDIGIHRSNETGLTLGKLRCNKKDIELAWEAVKHARNARIHTFIATSGIPMEYTLMMKKEEVVEKARHMMKARRMASKIVYMKFFFLISFEFLFTLNTVEEYSGLRVQPHNAIVGANAFAHESGIHQDGMLKNTYTYEIMSPEDIGLFRSNESGLTLGKLSRRLCCLNLFSISYVQLGYDIDGRERNDVFWRFKSVAKMKKVVTDDDLIALLSDEVFQPTVVWTFGDVQLLYPKLIETNYNTGYILDNDGTEQMACSTGTGPVDYSMSAVTAGIDAIASTRVIISVEDDHTTTHASGEQVSRTYSCTYLRTTVILTLCMNIFVAFVGSGTGASMDICQLAYVGAINKMLGLKQQSTS